MKQTKIDKRMSVQKPVSTKQTTLPYIKFVLIVLLYIVEAKKG